MSCNQLWHAAQRGKIDTVNVFLRNADHLLGSLGSHRRTQALCKSLHIAVKNCHESTVGALLAAGADPSLDAVCVAACTDNVRVLQRLVDAHGSVNSERSAARKPLIVAATTLSSACIARLITLNANVHTQCLYSTPLSFMLWGCMTHRIEPVSRRKSMLRAVRCLLNAKQDPNVLQHAVDVRRYDVACLLLNANACVGPDVLNACALKGLPFLFRRMWARLIPVHKDGEDGEQDTNASEHHCKHDTTAFEQHCALTYACLRNDKCAVAQLIAAGTRLMPERVVDILQRAVRWSQLGKVRLLVQAKADLDFALAADDTTFARRMDAV